MASSAATGAPAPAAAAIVASENPRSRLSSRGYGNGERIGDGEVLREGRKKLAGRPVCPRGAAILSCSVRASRAIHSNRAGGLSSFQPPGLAAAIDQGQGGCVTALPI